MVFCCQAHPTLMASPAEWEGSSMDLSRHPPRKEPDPGLIILNPSCQHFAPLDYLLSTTKYYHLNYLKHTFISGREHFGVHLSVQLPDQREGGRQRPQHRGRDHSAQVLVTGGSKQFLANTGCKSGRPGRSGNEERATLASQWVDSSANQIPAFHLQQGRLPFDHFGGRPHPFTYSRANWLNLAMLQGSIRQLAWSDCGNFVASGDTDRCVSVYTQNRWTKLSQTFLFSSKLDFSKSCLVLHRLLGAPFQWELLGR